MNILWQDLRYAIRMLMKRPGFAAVAVITMALGIGANTAIFSVVNAVLLRPLPYVESDRLVTITHSYPALKLYAPVSPMGFADYRDQSDVFENMAVTSGWSVNLTGQGEPERISGRLASADFFPTLKVKAAIGRVFSVEEDQPGNERVVVLNHGFWRERFASDPNILGKTLNLNGNVYAIIGVLPEGFEYGNSVKLYAPLALSQDQLTNRGSEYLSLLSRLKPGVSIASAQSQMDTIAARIKEQNLGGYPADWGLAVQSLNELVVGDIRPALLVLLGAVGFVLLIACANVANLMLARAAARQKEVAIRTALGASRFRIIRQLVTESVLLSLAGGVLGSLLAVWAVNLLISIDETSIPRAKEINADISVLGFTLLISLLTGVLFGLAPAIQASRITLNETLKEGGRGSTGGRRQRLFRGGLVVSEIALALVLLVGAGLMIKSFARLLDVNPGFHTDNLLTMVLSLPNSKYGERKQISEFYWQAIERIQAIPGIESASAISALPLSGSVWSGNFTIQGRPPVPAGELAPHSDRRAITPDYFRALSIPLMKGRVFSDADSADGPPIAIIDETMAEKYWPGEDPIGRHLTFQSNDGQPVWREIVGIVGPVKHKGLDGIVRGQLYVPHAQVPIRGMYIAARTASEPSDFVAAVKGVIQSLDKDLPVYDIKTMDEYLANSVAEKRFSMLLLGLFAAVALALAVIGMYGVISYSVAQRTHEIGIRMALGAQKRDVLKLVVGHGVILSALGLGLGLGAAFALTRLMESLLFQVSATDPITFVGTALLLAGVAIVASYIPARRATKVDPMEALRYE